MSTTLKRIIPDDGLNTDFDTGLTAAQKINYNSELIEKKLDSVKLGGGVPGDDGRGITNIERTSGTGEAGTVDTYTIYYTDATTSTFSVRNGANGITPVPGQNGNWYIGTIDTGAKAVAVDGRGIVSNTRISGDGSAGTIDTYRITYTDDTHTDYTVVNGTSGNNIYQKSATDDSTDGVMNEATFITEGKSEFLIPEDMDLDHDYTIFDGGVMVEPTINQTTRIATFDTVPLGYNGAKKNKITYKYYPIQN